MAEVLSVRNFGPIQEADIEVKDLTILVGPQATGKSITAQLLYLMYGLERLTNHSVEQSLDERQHVLQARDAPVSYTRDPALESAITAVEWWFGSDVSVYASANTALCWNPQSPSIDTEYEMQWDDTGPKLSRALEARIRSKQFPLHISRRLQVYIPAGRALYSFMPPASALSFLSRNPFRVQWPGYVITFYETLGAAIRQLWRRQGFTQLTAADAFPNTELNAAIEFVHSRMDAAIKGQVRYNSDTVALEVGEQLLRPETVAAGQMEIWPFWTILQEILLPKIELPRDRVYFEEPEAHLHPGAQRHILDSIACLVRLGMQFVITTHSPYVLYAINNALMAQQVLDEGKGLPPGIPQEITLRADQVAAYRFSANGHVYDIMDAEVGLIDEDELDQVADDLGSDFTSLQDQLEDIM